MRYSLMHKDVNVFDMEMDEDTGLVMRVTKIHSMDNLPVGTCIKGVFDRHLFNEWWGRRSIPEGRSEISGLLEVLDIPNARVLLKKSFGLSLSDQYWISPYDSDIRWIDVNFFDNGFPQDIGNLLFGSDGDHRPIVISSPDLTTDGMLMKRWMIIDGECCLIKAGNQEPFNEVIASVLMDALKIDHIPYSIVHIDGMPCSCCEDFIDTETELVSASRIFLLKKRRGDASVYDHYVGCCEDLGMDVITFLDRMMVIDFIIANGDRHMNNFGLIRNADTLEWLGTAPIFDNGSSLGYNILTENLEFDIGLESKPFRRRFEDQMKLVTSFDWIDFDALYGSLERVEEIMGSAGRVIMPDRQRILMRILRSRIDRLSSIAGDR